MLRVREMGGLAVRLDSGLAIAACTLPRMCAVGEAQRRARITGMEENTLVFLFLTIRTEPLQVVILLIG